MAQHKYNRIKAALAEAGRTSQELAEFMGVYATTVSDWCTNKNQPSVQNLHRISEFLRIDIRLLLMPTNWEAPVRLVAEEEPAVTRPKKKKAKTVKRKRSK